LPELPEVENVKMSLEPKLIGRTIVRINILDPKPIKFNEVDDFVTRLTGRKISAIQRRGKFLLLDMLSDVEGSEVENLIVHLAMVGKFLFTNGDYSELEPNVKNWIFIELVLDDGNVMIYSDYRKFGSMRVVTDDVLNFGDYRYHPLKHLKCLREMGPEPFNDDAEDVFLANIRANRYYWKPVKDILLEQVVVAGIGNIYANEACFPAATHPFASIGLLSDDKLREIFRHARDLMALSITLGGSSIRDYTDGDGKAGTFQDHLKVYGIDTCQVCATPIQMEQLNKRPTFWCPTCQPE
jgi:formamidopyrimidine-DNA glycosylase